MRKSLTYKILAALMAASSISMYGFVNTVAAANYTVQQDGEILSNNYTNIFGNGYKFTFNGNANQIYGAGNTNPTTGDINGSNLNINGGTVTFVYGGYSTNGNVSQSYITIDDGNITNTVYGGFSSYSAASNNHVTINSGIVNAVEGGHNGSKGTANNNYVTINGGTITGNNGGSVSGGYASYGNEANYNEVNITGGTINCDISGGYSRDDASNNKINISGGIINKSTDADTEEGIHGGHSRYNANYNEISISGGTINVEVYGGYLLSNGTSNNNKINISGNANIDNAKLFGSNRTNGTGNTLSINGWSGSTHSVQNFNNINFENVNWNNGGTVLNITTNDRTNALANTNININSLNFAGGAELTTGESMTIINGNNSSNSLGIGSGTGTVTALRNFTAGVTLAGTGTAEVAADGNSVKYTLTEVKHLDQIDLVAENRAVAAAFVNQGTDLIADSLDVLSRDSNYGVKTFAAVHGNKSKYDVNSDIKINGWSVIAGVGNAAEFADGDNFSWGVFYENGSGNYRTYNEFNNEFFRGDGSLVYNGGGIAARYKNKNGVYTEGSLRAGMLKSDMDNALRDASGNIYGYESESAYYGAHIGVGKIISLSENSDLDIYGKFFHTYVEGDSFNVAGDNFDFDSINSDRLRVGARVTTNKENKFSTYYGLAYEYEFNGDADMKAAGISAPTQSLQGSSYMAELGLNYQPTPTSPWSFDLNLRGYTGERQGGSFNVQATYTF